MKNMLITKVSIIASGIIMISNPVFADTEISNLDEEIVFNSKIVDNIIEIDIDDYSSKMDVYYQYISISKDEIDIYNDKEEELLEDIAEVKEEIDKLEDDDNYNIEEYNDKIDEYNLLSEEANSKLFELIPYYDDSDWIESDDDELVINKKLVDDAYFVVQVKVIESNGDELYNRAIYNTYELEDSEEVMESYSLKMSKGNTYTLEVPDISTDSENIEWKSYDEEIATVKDGKVVAKKIG